MNIYKCHKYKFIKETEIEKKNNTEWGGKAAEEVLK